MNTSKTARKQVPAIFKKVQKHEWLGGWTRGACNFDIGAGPYENFSLALAELSVLNIPYDPENLSDEQNLKTLHAIMIGEVATATISNVFNVLPNNQQRAMLLRMAFKALKEGGRIFITVYEGDRSWKGKATRDGWQANLPLSDYVGIVQTVFPDAFMKYGVIMARKPRRVSLEDLTTAVVETAKECSDHV
jgi:hypothetical protein